MFSDIKTFLLSDNLFLHLQQLLMNLGLALVIFVVGRWLSVQLVAMLDRLLRLRRVDEGLRVFLSHVLAHVINLMVLLIAIDQLGVDTTSLLALLGAAGLAVGLALKDSLSNFAAGVMLILFKPFKIGDAVEAGGQSGMIESISIVSTMIRSADNKEIIVPNSKIFGGTIINASSRPTRRIDMTLTIVHGSDVQQARHIILQILAADARVLADPATLVAVNELLESGIQLVVRPWVANNDYWPVKWACLEQITLEFERANILFAAAPSGKKVGE